MTPSPTHAVIALDVDGTLYHDAAVAPECVDAIARANESGHVVILVTGRRWESLADVVPEVLPHCTLAVCENGGAMIRPLQSPAAPVTSLLARPVADELVAALLHAGVQPLDVGMVALGAPSVHATAARRVVDDNGGDEVIVHNKDSIMVLPPGCDKGSGLDAALRELSASDWQVIALGDAENDLPMFARATHPMGVANSDAAVVASGVPLTRSVAGRGVAEALHALLAL